MSGKINLINISFAGVDLPATSIEVRIVPSPARKLYLRRPRFDAGRMTFPHFADGELVDVLAVHGYGIVGLVVEPMPRYRRAGR